MTRVELHHVFKRYGAVEAVKDLNLNVAEGEFVALLGPSGCGKTSTLRMVAGLEEISAGEVRIGGRRVNEVSPRGRDIAMVFEDYALYPHMTVYENIAFPLRLRRLPPSEIEEKVARAMAMLGLVPLRDENVRRLSGGAQQRVSIGRAIVRNPSVLLMDEPISHLDAGHKVELRGELKRLQRTLGVTTLYVTHDQVEAMALADRIAIMHLGVLKQVGTPEEVYRHPANEFVAGFIGEPPMNFLPCEVLSEGGEVRLRGPAWEIPLSSTLGKCLQARGPKRVRLGIRPADVEVGRDGTPLTPTLWAEAFAFEPRGDWGILTVLLGQTRFLAEVPSAVAPGTRVGLRLHEDLFHLFDEGTGERLF
jgi:ABC-type sugar transport system ATPase subunit